MEELLACAILHLCGLAEKEEYVQKLDKLFLEKESDDCLLELEFCSGDCEKSLFLLNAWLEASAGPIYMERFAGYIMKGLKQAYQKEHMDIREFGKRAYQVWGMLPPGISREHPLYILSYADDPLSWGDEAQSRSLYQAAFAFYDDSFSV